MRYLLLIILLSCLSSVSLANPLIKKSSVIEYQYHIVASYPHSTEIFTQGLEYRRGLLYESAGQRSQSRVTKRSLNAAKPIKTTPLLQRYFGEGLSLLNNQLFQLTWQSGRGFIYHPDTLEKIGDFPIDGEGWGLTNNGQHLIVSNGSSQISFVDPENFSIVRTLNVTFDGIPVPKINELEWVDGVIYANIWQSDWIVMIDSQSGYVVGKVFLKNLLPDELRSAKTDVLNGIAFDHQEQRLLVTGKYWPRIYHIELTAIK
jgi:glutamine cyclotransferase|tara:strand:+ start:8710 stop:9489 length:780 start_codon:yes stop_codon:yes gene_type:complete